MCLPSGVDKESRMLLYINLAGTNENQLFIQPFSPYPNGCTKHKHSINILVVGGYIHV